MKKVFLLFSIVVFSCSQEETPQRNNPDEPNCDCDRVVEVSTFSIIGTPQNPATNYYSIYTTINDCTQIQREKTFTTINPNLSPQLGQCR